MDVICPACGLPASSILVWGIRLIGCPCATNRAFAFPLPLTVIMTTAENHDPGDEDRSER